MRVPHTALLLAATGLCACRTHPPGDIDWASGLSAAHAAAAARDRPVVAYFHFEGCVACRALETQAFTDAAVAARSAEFSWVDIDLHDAPDVVQQFSVQAFPSVLVLGPRDENIHRFVGFREPEQLIAELDEADRRWALFRAGQPWDAIEPDSAPLVDGVSTVTLAAPAHVASTGMTMLGGELWIAHLYDRLYRLDPGTGAVAGSFELQGLIRDICTDGELIYALDASWNCGGPIRVIDPRSGEVVREIVTEANRDRPYSEMQGLAWRGGRLWVLDGGDLVEVDPASGAVGTKLRVGLADASGLDADADTFLVGGDEFLRVLDARSGRELRRIPLDAPVRSVARLGETVYLTRQPIWGHDREHVYVQLWPQPGGGSIHRVDPGR